MRRLLTACALLGGAAALGACSAPPDPISLGQLCAPARSGCPARTVLARQTSAGRNAVDYRVTNLSEEPAEMFLQAGPEALFIEAQRLDLGIADLGPGGVTAPQIDEEFFDLYTARERVIAPGETLHDRLLPDELGREARVVLDISCVPTSSCELEMDYVLVIEPLECAAPEDCAGGWECDVDRGQCAECIAGRDQCAEDQRCELGRCVPPQQSQCQSASPGAGPAPAPSPWLWGLLVGLLGGAMARRAGARWRGGVGRGAWGGALALGLCAPSPPAHAAPPRAGLHVGMSGQGFTGQLSEYTQLGVGISAGQELRWRYAGAGITLSTASFLTSPESEEGTIALPFNRRLLTYSVQVGPRGYVPVWRDELELWGQLNYERFGLASNTLVEVTGLVISSHGAAAGAGVRYTWAPVSVELRGAYHWIPALPGDMVTVTLALGVTSLR